MSREAPDHRHRRSDRVPGVFRSCHRGQGSLRVPGPRGHRGCRCRRWCSPEPAVRSNGRNSRTGSPAPGRSGSGWAPATCAAQTCTSSTTSCRPSPADHPRPRGRRTDRQPGADGTGLSLGERVGSPWLGHVRGTCRYCLDGQQNPCDDPLLAGFTCGSGFATSANADARFALPLGETGDDVALAPLLCAGLIGWRSLATPGGSAYSASAPRPTSSRRSPGGRDAGSSRSPARRPRHPGTRAQPGCCLGGRIRPGAARTARCRNHLRNRRPPGAGGAEGDPPGRPGGSAPGST